MKNCCLTLPCGIVLKNTSCFLNFREGLERFYGISYLWFSALGVIITVCVGLFVSWCTKGKGIHKHQVSILVKTDITCNLRVICLTLQTLQDKRRRLVKYQTVWGWRCGRIFVWVCAFHHISSKKKWNKSRYLYVYDRRYTLIYMCCLLQGLESSEVG